MPPKRHLPPSSCRAKCTHLSSTTIPTTLNASNVATLSITNLVSLPAKTLRSHLKGHGLSATGNKVTMANCLYTFLHPSLPAAATLPETSATLLTVTTTTSAATPAPVTTTSSTVAVPRQLMEKLSMFLNFSLCLKFQTSQFP